MGVYPICRDGAKFAIWAFFFIWGQDLEIYPGGCRHARDGVGHQHLQGSPQDTIVCFAVYEYKHYA